MATNKDYVTQHVQAVSTAEVREYIVENAGKQMVTHTFAATGNHAASSLNVYRPRNAYHVNIAAAATSVATDYYLTADVSGGHLVNGHTVSTNDFVLLPGSSGWVLEDITAVTDDAATFYISVGTTSGLALTTSHKCYIVRAADVVNYVIGNAAVNWTDRRLAGDTGAPLVFSADSGDATDTDVTLTVQLLDGSKPLS